MSRVLNFYEVEDQNLENSDPEEDELEHSGPKKQKLEYKQIKNFPSAAEGFNFVKSQKLWSQRFTRTSNEGKRIYYNCKYSRNCPLKMCIHFEPDKQDLNILVIDTDW